MNMYDYKNLKIKTTTAATTTTTTTAAAAYMHTFPLKTVQIYLSILGDSIFY